ncbi:MAG: hypothetical protein K8I82_18850 [Anaerolineae bacterium]|nr:hypothetical protein [Anaerolineae bacterium]
MIRWPLPGGRPQNYSRDLSASDYVGARLLVPKLRRLFCPGGSPSGQNAIDKILLCQNREYAYNTAMRILILILVLGVLVPAKTGFALSCAPPDANESYRAHQFVFTGMVISVHEVGELSSRQEDGVMNTFSYAVVKLDKVYKGRLFGTVKVYANNYWGQPFEPGARFVVYADMEEGRLISPLCSGTMPVEAAQDHLEILRSIER